jgi:hypothetical protein
MIYEFQPSCPPFRYCKHIQLLKINYCFYWSAISVCFFFDFTRQVRKSLNFTSILIFFYSIKIYISSYSSNLKQLPGEVEIFKNNIFEQLRASLDKEYEKVSQYLKIRWCCQDERHFSCQTIVRINTFFPGFFRGITYYSVR